MENLNFENMQGVYMVKGDEEELWKEISNEKEIYKKYFETEANAKRLLFHDLWCWQVPIKRGPVSYNLNYFGNDKVEEVQVLYDNLINQNETTIIFSLHNSNSVVWNCRTSKKPPYRIPLRYGFGGLIV